MSYRSPSNPRSPSERYQFQFNSNLPLNSSLQTPKPTSNLGHEGSTYFSQTKHSRTLTSENTGRMNFQSSETFETRERKLEEQFHHLLDRCNKSKEFINNMQKMVHGDKNDGQRLYASAQTLNIRSPVQSNISTTTRTFQDVEHGNKYHKRYDIKDHIVSKNDDDEDYEKLENEVVDLKRSIMDRLRNKDANSSKRIKDIVADGLSDEDEIRYNTLKENRSPKTATWQNDRVSSTRNSRLVGYGGEEERDEFVKGAKEEKTKAEKNLSKLKTTLKEKERIQQEKYANLKGKSKELKNVLRDYVTRVIDLEENLKKKDEQIIEFEEQVRKGQEELIKNEETINVLKKTEESIRKSEVEAKNINIEYKVRLSEQNEKLESLEEAIRRSKEIYNDEMNQISQENEKLRIEVEVLKEKEFGLVKRNEGLEREVVTLKDELDRNKGIVDKLELQQGDKDADLKELRAQVDRLKADNGILEFKIKEVKDVLRQNNDKLIQEERKYEDELSRIREEKEREQLHKKEKIANLKQQIRELEVIIQKAIEEKKIAELEIERAHDQKHTVEKELNRVREDVKLAKEEIFTLRAALESLKNQNDEIYRSLQQETDKSGNLQNEKRRLEKILQALEEKLEVEEREAQNLNEINEKLKVKVKELLEETSVSRDFIEKLETQLTYLQGKQSQELQAVEEKIQSFSHEVHELRDENSELRSCQDELQRELNNAVSDRDKYKKDYKNLKQVNRALERDIRELDMKIKDAASEKAIEIEEHHREINHQRQLNSKLKVLDEIQGMIKTHRLSQRK